MAVTLAWDLEPEAALAFFRDKGLETSFAWQDIVGEEHDVAFTVAKMLDVDLLSEVRDSVDRAIAEGKTLREFTDELKPTLVERGWWGRAEMTDPATGAIEEVQLGSPRRLRTIFHTNMMTAYSAGHWSRIEDHKAEAPYLMYDAVRDSRTRPQHAAWDGTVRHVDDSFWDAHYPPNGWNCRCSVIQLDRQQLDSEGLEVSDPPPQVEREWTNPRTGEVHRIPGGVDPGWAYNPGRSRADRVRELMREKAAAAGDLGTAAQAALDRSLQEGNGSG